MATIRVKRTTGSTTPTGLTFGEPAYVQGIKSLYIGQTGGDPAIRIGAEVTTDSTFASASDNKIPSQLAVKTYVDSNVAGAVSSLNGLTGTVFIGAGTAINLAVAGKGITVTNTGVQSAAAGSGISVSGSTGAVTITNTGVTGLVAGTAISVSSSTGNITVTNTGVTSLVAGNQATVSASTGAVTIGVTSNPSFTTITTTGNGTVGGNLTVTGNLTINGTTTTVNADTMTIDDPMITLGLSGGVPLTVSDGGKDRGIAFSYFNVTGKTGFFGYDSSTGYFTIVPDATITNDVVSGGVGNANFNLISLDSYLYLNNGASYTRLNSTSSGTRLVNFADHGGTIVVPSDLGTSGYILKSNGDPNQPTWINPNSAGFTAFTSTNVATTSDSADTLAYIAFVNTATDSNQAIKYNSGLTYNASTNAISATTFIGALSGNATTATSLQTARTIGITGDVWGSASFDGTANINISATIQPDSVALGTDTTGNFVATLSTTAGAGLTLSGSGVENAAVTINLSKITSGIDFGNFAFTTGEFTNSSGTVAIGTVDGGTF